MYKLYSLIFCTLVLVACSSEQLKRGTYYSLHEKQRQDCIESGRADCDQHKYDSYEEYERKSKEQ
jgi:hypothetical protein